MEGGVWGVLLPERWARQRQTGGQREKNKGRGHTTLGEEGRSCGLVEPPVLRMSVVHLDLAGSPSQGESWVGFKRLLDWYLCTHKVLPKAAFSPSCRGLAEQV